MIEIDDAGMTKHGRFRSHTLRWGEIVDYRLRIRPNANTSPGGMSAWVNAYRFAKAATQNSSSPTDDIFRDMYLQLWLIGNSTTIEATGFGLDGLRVCNEAMSRVHPRLAARADNEIDREDVGRFGPLMISERGIQ